MRKPTDTEARGRSDQSPDNAVRGSWEDVVASMRQIKTEYAENGFETLVFNPGNIESLGDREEADVEFDVLVPSNEFDQFDTWVDEGFTPSTFEAYKNSEDDVVHVIVATADDQRVCIFPLHYKAGDETSLVASAKKEGTVTVELRPLSGDGVHLTFDPETFFEDPPGEA